MLHNHPDGWDCPKCDAQQAEYLGENLSRDELDRMADVAEDREFGRRYER